MSTGSARRRRFSSTCLLHKYPWELRQTVVPGCTPDQSPFRAQNAPEKEPIYDRESILAHSTPFHGRWRAHSACGSPLKFSFQVCQPFYTTKLPELKYSPRILRTPFSQYRVHYKRYKKKRGHYKVIAKVKSIRCHGSWSGKACEATFRARGYSSFSYPRAVTISLRAAQLARSCF